MARSVLESSLRAVQARCEQGAAAQTECVRRLLAMRLRRRAVCTQKQKKRTCHRRRRLVQDDGHALDGQGLVLEGEDVRHVFFFGGVLSSRRG